MPKAVALCVEVIGMIDTASTSMSWPFIALQKRGFCFAYEPISFTRHTSLCGNTIIPPWMAGEFNRIREHQENHAFSDALQAKGRTAFCGYTN
jgi:hypothetical protein